MKSLCYSAKKESEDAYDVSTSLTLCDLAPLFARSAPVSWCWKKHSQKCLVAAAAVAAAVIAKHSEVQPSMRAEASRVSRIEFVLHCEIFPSDAICQHRAVNNYGTGSGLSEL